MLRADAVQRINDGLGFLATGNSMEAKIVLRLQEAQRDLEKGKTLPRFLLVEEELLTLAAAAHTAALPTGFLRDYDDNLLHYTTVDTDIPIFLARRFYVDAVLGNMREDTDPVAPSVYVIRKTEIDFITIADQAYSLYWSYYKAAALLTTDVENAWLANASDWLIGKAGARMARDARDAEAVELFSTMEREGRAAVFGDDLTLETSGGPLQMGANL